MGNYCFAAFELIKVFALFFPPTFTICVELQLLNFRLLLLFDILVWKFQTQEIY